MVIFLHPFTENRFFSVSGSVKCRIASDCLAARGEFVHVHGWAGHAATLAETNRQCGSNATVEVLGATALVKLSGHAEERLYEIVTLPGLGCTALLTSAFE